VNQWLNPLKSRTGSNLVDMGRAVVRASQRASWDATPKSDGISDEEATVNACGVAVARPQRQSWSPIPSTGAW